MNLKIYFTLHVATIIKTSLSITYKKQVRHLVMINHHNNLIVSVKAFQYIQSFEYSVIYIHVFVCNRKRQVLTHQAHFARFLTSLKCVIKLK